MHDDGSGSVDALGGMGEAPSREEEPLMEGPSEHEGGAGRRSTRWMALIGAVLGIALVAGVLVVVRGSSDEPACDRTLSHPEWSVARQWDEALLDAIRRDLPAPTVHADPRTGRRDRGDEAAECAGMRRRRADRCASSFPRASCFPLRIRCPVGPRPDVS